MKKILFFLLLLICAVSINAQNINLNKNLVAYYPFNGNANDYSGNNNNGVIHGAKLTKDRFGKPNSAYEFNGINNTIDVPNSYTLDFSNDKLTLSFWMKPINSSNMYGEYINKYSGIGRTVSGFMISFRSNIIYYMYADVKTTGGWGGSETDLSYLNEKWLHIVVTTDNGYDKIYVNGNFVNISKTKHNYHIGSNNQNLRFGAGPTQNVGKYYNGCFDDIRIYNRAISPGEVLSLYNQICDTITVRDTIYYINNKKFIYNDTIFNTIFKIDSIINKFNTNSDSTYTTTNHNYINLDTITTTEIKRDTIHNEIISSKNDISKLDTTTMINTITTNITISNIDTIYNTIIINKIISYTDIITIINYTNKTSIDDNVFNFKVYPNPAYDFINISPDIKSAEIYNILGTKMLISNSNQFNISQLLQGTYIIKTLGLNNNIYINKFIKN